jgi:hypothetical protein
MPEKGRDDFGDVGYTVFKMDVEEIKLERVRQESNGSGCTDSGKLL